MEKSLIATGLAASFLAIANSPKIEVFNIDGLGQIGLKQLTIENRDTWLKAQKDNDNATIVLLQCTVCEPETGELVLKQLSVDELRQLPMSVVNEIVEKVFDQNGIKTSKDKADAELKNSEANQS